MKLSKKLIQLKEIKTGLSESFSTFLEEVCENLPLNLTIYEEKGMCTAESTSCKCSEFIGEEYLCKKKAYNLSEEAKLNYLNPKYI